MLRTSTAAVSSMKPSLVAFRGSLRPYFGLLLVFLALVSLASRRCWIQTVSHTPDSEGSESDSCATWLSETCAREAAVARFMRDQLEHVMSLMTIIEDTGMPALSMPALDPYDIKYRIRSPRWSDDEDTRVLRALDMEWQIEILDLGLALGLVQGDAEVSFGNMRLAFRNAHLALERALELRSISADRGTSLVQRLQAGRAVKGAISPVAERLQRKLGYDLALINEKLSSLVAHASAAAVASAKLVTALNAVIARAERELDEIPRIVRWAYRIVNARWARDMHDDLPHLRHAHNVISPKAEVVYIIHENALLLQEYMAWWNTSMPGVLQHYKPSGLRSFDDELDSAISILKDFYGRVKRFTIATSGPDSYYKPRRRLAGRFQLPSGDDSK